MEDHLLRSLFEDTEVRLRFSIGRIPLDIQTLRDLAPGTILDFGKQLGAPVEMLLDETSIGQGELVNIEGSLGVRIRQLKVPQ